MVDVFISYSRTDRAAVARLAEAVEREGYKVWWDAELPVHQSYSDVITDKIGRAKAAIVVWSPDAAKSEWVRAEADVARNQKKLIQTCIGEVMPPLPFNQIQFAEIGDWHGEADHAGWGKVKRSLADLVHHEAYDPDDSPPSAPPPQHPYSQPHGYAAPPPPVRTAGATRWPLYAGLGVAVAGMLAAGAFILGARDGEEVAVQEEVAIATASKDDDHPELARTKAELARVQQQLAAHQSAAAGGGAPAMALVTYQAGFDCTRASTSVERMICTSPELAGLDRKLSTAYDQALSDAPGPAQRLVLRATQRQFLRGRNACRTVDCLTQAYQDRLHDLAIGAHEDDAA